MEATGLLEISQGERGLDMGEEGQGEEQTQMCMASNKCEEGEGEL